MFCDASFGVVAKLQHIVTISIFSVHALISEILSNSLHSHIDDSLIKCGIGLIGEWGVRYVKQKDHYSCGPIAIMNALKWAGLYTTYKTHFHKIRSLCKTTISWGTTPDNMSAALLKHRKYLSFVTKSLVTLREIEKHLDSGGAVILEYWFWDEMDYDGHYVFIFREYGYDFIAVNDMSGAPTAKPCPRDMLKSMLSCKKYRHTGSPSAWFISKNG